MNRLADFEDNFTERKPASVNARDLHKAIVAFANSVPENRAAIIYIGVGNDGSPRGLPNPDSLQKTVRNICDHDCFPPIKASLEVLDVVGKSVIAVVVPSSANRPYFSGPAYIRRGSESVQASQEIPPSPRMNLNTRVSNQSPKKPASVRPSSILISLRN
jgi:predicted HTH transcriptional regulator